MVLTMGMYYVYVWHFCVLSSNDGIFGTLFEVNSSNCMGIFSRNRVLFHKCHSKLINEDTVKITTFLHSQPCIAQLVTILCSHGEHDNARKVRNLIHRPSFYDFLSVSLASQRLSLTVSLETNTYFQVRGFILLVPSGKPSSPERSFYSNAKYKILTKKDSKQQISSRDGKSHLTPETF